MKMSANLNGPGNANQVLLGDKLVGCGRLSDCLRGKLSGVTFSQSGNPINTRRMSKMTIFVDGVQQSGTDLDNLNSNDVYSIEVLTSGSYLAIYGSNAPGGALIITLKHGSDLGWNKTVSETVDGLVTYDFKGYSKVREFYSPKYISKAPDNDQRETIYWNPNIVTDERGNASFEYFNAGSKGNYRVVIEGIDGDGNLGRVVYKYEVK
jgi:hypothetical protein